MNIIDTKDEYLNSLITEAHLSKNTKDTYSYCLDKYVEYLNSKKIFEISDISKKDILSFLEKLKNDKVTTSTLAHHLTVIKNYHKFYLTYQIQA